MCATLCVSAWPDLWISCWGLIRDPFYGPLISLYVLFISNDFICQIYSQMFLLYRLEICIKQSCIFVVKDHEYVAYPFDIHTPPVEYSHAQGKYKPTGYFHMIFLHKEFSKGSPRANCDPPTGLVLPFDYLWKTEK